jgi:ribonuclease Z
MIRVTFLGTAAVVPDGGHDSASFVINGHCLVDTGWYSAIKMRQYGLNPLDIDTLIFTHFHHDHYIGLPQILFYRAMRAGERPGLPPLKIVGPAEDLERVVGLAKQLLQPDRFPEMNLSVELLPLKPGETMALGDLRLETCSSLHPVPGLCYRVTDQVTGTTLAFTGDTAYHPPVVELARGASLLIHEASYGAKAAPASNPSLHSGAPDAARVAVEAGVGRLALIHGLKERQGEAVAAARAIFPNTFWPEDGETVSLEP